MTQVFVSTTSLGQAPTDLADVLSELAKLPLDGWELGSTHRWRGDLLDVVARHRPRRLLTHNFFPPAPSDLVMNIASPDAAIRRASLEHATVCLDFAAEVGAELYTIHPGFLASSARMTTRAVPGSGYDFSFSTDRAPHEQAFTRMRDALGEIMVHAAERGVPLAVETEGSMTNPGILLLERPEEYRRLFDDVGTGLNVNLNLAHTRLASIYHGFDLASFIAELWPRIAAVELSENDGRVDLHQALHPDSYVVEWLPKLPDVPMVLEFREAKASQLLTSALLVREARA